MYEDQSVLTYPHTICVRHNVLANVPPTSQLPLLPSYPPSINRFEAYATAFEVTYLSCTCEQIEEQVFKIDDIPKRAKTGRKGDSRAISLKTCPNSNSPLSPDFVRIAALLAGPLLSSLLRIIRTDTTPAACTKR